MNVIKTCMLLLSTCCLNSCAQFTGNSVKQTKFTPQTINSLNGTYTVKPYGGVGFKSEYAYNYFYHGRDGLSFKRRKLSLTDNFLLIDESYHTPGALLFIFGDSKNDSSLDKFERIQ